MQKISYCYQICGGRSHKADFRSTTWGSNTTPGTQSFRIKGHVWLTEEHFRKYQILWLDSLEITLMVCQILNSMILLLSENVVQLIQVCVEQVYSNRLNLWNEHFYTPSCSLAYWLQSLHEKESQNGKLCHFVDLLSQVIEAQILPSNTSAQKAEVITTAL